MGTDTIGIASALGMALAGGLILNLMPCVLPVLSLKAMSLAGASTRSIARRRAVAYTAGVCVSFLALGGLVLALRAAGLSFGWGFQLQQPVVVGALAVVMALLGFNMSGLWQVGGAWMGVGHGLASREGLAGDFFTGVLAVVVATPCTAPFLGSALAYAFIAPAAHAMAVFLAVGLGLALPFLLIGLVPALSALLPRPGAWMETLKQALAFPLYLTAAWLLWVLGRQRGVDAMIAGVSAVLLAAAVVWALSVRQRRAAGVYGPPAVPGSPVSTSEAPRGAIGFAQAPGVQ